MASTSTTTFLTSLDSSASMTSMSGWFGTEMPNPSHSSIWALCRHLPMLHMLLEALQAWKQPWGTSVVATEVYILWKYPIVDVIWLKYLLKWGLDISKQHGLLVRPTNSEAKVATGNFKLVPKHTHTKTAHKDIHHDCSHGTQWCQRGVP